MVDAGGQGGKQAGGCRCHRYANRRDSRRGAHRDFPGSLHCKGVVVCALRDRALAYAVQALHTMLLTVCCYTIGCPRYTYTP